jgi:uncharacterized RDD family membrane protein YckC
MPDRRSSPTDAHQSGWAEIAGAGEASKIGLPAVRSVMVGFECGRCGAGLGEGWSHCAGCGGAVAAPGTDHGNRSPLARRAASWAIDLLLIAVVFGTVSGLVAAVLPGDGKGGGPAGVVDTVNLLLLPAAYLIAAEARFGRTLGKRAVGLRVAAVDGSPALGWRTAAVRHLGRLLSLLPLAAGYLVTCGPRRRAWHDIFSDTVVIDAAAPVVVEAGRTAPAPVVAAAPTAGSSVAVPVAAPPVAPPARPVANTDPSGPPSGPSAAAHSPVSPALLRTMAEVLAAREHVDEAADVLIAALHADRSTESAEWCDAALLLVETGRGDEALRIVNEVLHRHPGHGRAEAIRALALLQVGRDTGAEARVSAETACEHDPTDPLARVALAFALHHLRRDDEAEAVLDAADVGAETSRAACCRLSIAQRRGDIDGARRWARVAAESTPFNSHHATRVARSLEDRAAPAKAGTMGLLWWEARDWLRAVFGVPANLTARTDVLVDGLTAEPHNHAVREALRTTRTVGHRSPAALLARAAFPYGLLGAVFTAAFFAAAPALGAAVTVVAAVLGGLLLRAYRIQRRLLSPAARSWIVYLQGIERVRAAHRRQAASKQTVEIPAMPDPPPTSPMAAPSRCVCDTLNALYGETAIAYARLHLVERRTHGDHLIEFICPATTATWLALEATEQRVVRLCRLNDPLPAETTDRADLPGHYL